MRVRFGIMVIEHARCAPPPPIIARHKGARDRCLFQSVDVQSMASVKFWRAYPRVVERFERRFQIPNDKQEDWGKYRKEESVLLRRLRFRTANRVIHEPECTRGAERKKQRDGKIERDTRRY